MSKTTANGFDFSKGMPGFDFLQYLGQQTAQQMSQMPQVGQWMTPSMDIEELEKRISELKIVQFWLDQNSAALKAGIQALEVQKMTLATLKEMQFQFAPGEQAQMAGGQKNKAQSAANTIDPQTWWNALTQQFQNIAVNVMGENAAAQAPAAHQPTAPQAAAPRKSTAAGTAKNKRSK